MVSRSGRTAVVTGASAGVGRATALKLAALGFDLGLIARDEGGLADVAQAAQKQGVQALACPADVADAKALDAAADRVSERFGGIDVWVNCAMATVFGRFDDISPEEFRRVTDVTYHGQVFGTQAALRHMRHGDRGVIVQVGSALAYRSIPLQSAYCGAKHAIVGFTAALRSELLHQRSGIKLCMVHLPAVNTPQFSWSRSHIAAKPRPAGQPIAPEVAGRAIAGAAIHPRREIYLGWPTVKAILGNMVLPSYGDRKAEEAWEGQLEAPAEEKRGNLFEPVTDVPRERGPFTDEAKGEALSISSLEARLAVATGVGLISAAMMTAAWLAGRGARRR